MKTIAVIDDDVYIGDMLEEVLIGEGYAVLRAYSGTEALYLLNQEKPDLILLDLMMPGLSGEEVLSKVQGIPVIVVSAKVEVSEKVKLLLNGAVDYMTKPFAVEELLARIMVQLRNQTDTEHLRILTFRNLEIDVDSHKVLVQGNTVRLTKTEYAILLLLMRNPKQILTKSQMLERLSEETPDCVESSLKVHISNLRRKLREMDGFDYIEAVWGIGFKLRE